jgi:hypothetical protein
VKVEKREKVDDYQSSNFKMKSRNKTKLVQRSSAFPLQIRKNDFLNESCCREPEAVKKPSTCMILY